MPTTNMHICTCARTRACLHCTVTALALYSSVKQYYSKLIMSDGPPSSQE